MAKSAKGRKSKAGKRTKRRGPKEPRHQEPPVSTQEVPMETRRGRRFWPSDQPLPTHYVKARRRLLPCPACRRIGLENGGQAVVCTSSGHDVAAFRCKACGHTWQMPVREV